MVNFRNYSIFSAVTAFAMIAHSYQKQDGNFFNTVVYLTSQKVNLLVFLNFFLVTLLQMGNILVWVFFDSIRTIELKVSEIGFKLCVIVHLGQVAEEDLPLPAGDHRVAFNPRLLQAALPGRPLPLLDRPLADLQAQ